MGLGIVNDLEENTPEAIRLIQKAIDFDPSNGSFYHVLAGAHEKQDNVDEANTAYLISLELDNNNDETLSDYIEFLLGIGHYREALEYVEAKELGPDVQMTKNLVLTNLYWKLDRKEEALNLLIVCISENEIEAKKIFSLYPELENESKIVNLFSN